MSLAETSLRRPVTAVMFYVSLVVIGLIAAFRLPLEQFPDVNVPFILVDLPYPGSTPEEVERTITILGIDEAQTSQGQVSWVAPVARALLKARVGDEVPLPTPAGVRMLEVLAVQYPPSSAQLK